MATVQTRTRVDLFLRAYEAASGFERGSAASTEVPDEYAAILDTAEAELYEGTVSRDEVRELGRDSSGSSRADALAALPAVERLMQEVDGDLGCYLYPGY